MPPDSDKPKKAESIATEIKHRFKARRPDFTPKWSKEWVIPDNVLLPEDAKVEMQVESKFPENRPNADIEVVQTWNDANVPDLPIPPLKLKGAKVVKNDNSVPAIKFVHDNKIWEDFEKLWYHFDCKIDQTTRRTKKSLKVKRWHVMAVDIGDLRPGFPAMRASEKNNFLGSFAGSANDAAHAWEFDAHATAFSQFGEKMKNAYTFVYTGHGAVMCRACGAMFDCRTGGAATAAEVAAGIPAPTKDEAEFGMWTTCSNVGCTGAPRSTHCIGPGRPAPSISFLDSTDIANDGTTPTTPKYLMFSVCCGGAFETSLYDAYIGRGTKYCIGFKKSTRCTWARDYAKSFFDTWAKTHKCDPARIPDVYNDLLAAWEVKLAPSIFGEYWGLGSRLRNLGRKIASLF